MRYTILLSDGDCKTFTHLKRLNVYPGFEIEKQECINHIGKHLNTALKKVIENFSTQRVKLDDAKAGSLTDAKIRMMQ